MSNTTRLLAILLGISMAEHDRKVAKEEEKKKTKKIIIEIKLK